MIDIKEDLNNEQITVFMDWKTWVLLIYQFSPKWSVDSIQSQRRTNKKKDTWFQYLLESDNNQENVVLVKVRHHGRQWNV